MADFQPINTQEELNAVISRRLERHTQTVTAEVEKKYEGYISPEERDKLTGQIAELTKAKETAEAAAKKAEAGALRMRIAAEKGLPSELAERLRGDTEEELRADAEGLSKLVGSAGTPPLADPEGEPRGEKDQALREMLSAIRH
jgi:hypothetical protein